MNREEPVFTSLRSFLSTQFSFSYAQYGGDVFFFSASLFNFFWRWKYINDSKKENKDNTSIHHVLAECSLVPLAAMRSPEEVVRNFIKKVSKRTR